MKRFLNIHESYIYRFGLFFLLIGLFFLLSCQNQSIKDVEKSIKPVCNVIHPEWSKNANIYEVNIRQYTEEGTFKAFGEHLPGLKDLGVKILWFMPIYPIGEKNRKGTLGSYYAVKDYTAVNPEYGTLADFKALVSIAHGMGFKVILDWVANHTAWDNQWIYDHPEWYTTDSTGKMVSPFDWSDVADLNFDNKELWPAMIDALKYWVTEADIDGYRCDVAGMVPTEFWEQAKMELDKIKPVFMLAEAEQPDHHTNAFDMSYAWELHHILNSIAKEKKDANDIESYFEKQDTLYPEGTYRMTFITNHDENSWNGTIEERMGEAGSVMAVLTYTLPGMPLIYSGQETGLNKRLEFFDKDQITWNPDSPLNAFYKTLNQLKLDNQALWNGQFGGDFLRIQTTSDSTVFAFIREKEKNKVFTITNLSSDIVSFSLIGNDYLGDYIDAFKGDEMIFEKEQEMELAPWEYLIFINN